MEPVSILACAAPLGESLSTTASLWCRASTIRWRSIAVSRRASATASPCPDHQPLDRSIVDGQPAFLRCSHTFVTLTFARIIHARGNMSSMLWTGPAPIEIVVDIPSTVMVTVALLFTLTACFFAVRFSRSIGGELGGAFKFVVAGFIVFAISRIDDMLKVSGSWAKAGIDYKRVL